MKALCLSVAFGVVSGVALAQGSTDPVADLRACSVMEREERTQCLENVLRNMAPTSVPVPAPAPARPVAGAGNWVVSETTSPVDYTPIFTATTVSQGGATDQPMQLWIRCRSGRTELVVTESASSGSGKDQAISYRIDDKQPVQLAGAQPSFGTGVAFSGDVVRILQSLPEQGELAIRLVSRAGAAKEGHFLLGGLKAARDRLAKVCKWPQTVAGPRN